MKLTERKQKRMKDVDERTAAAHDRDLENITADTEAKAQQAEIEVKLMKEKVETEAKLMKDKVETEDKLMKEKADADAWKAEADTQPADVQR